MRRLLCGFAVACSLLFIAACGKEEGFGEEVIPVGFVRVMNAIPDSPELILSVSNGANRAVNFGDSTPYFQVLPALTLRLNVVYRQGDTVANLLVDEPLFVDVSADMTVILTGSMDNPQVIKIGNPPLSELVGTGKLEVQIANAATALANPATITLRDQDSLAVTQSTLDAGAISERVRIDPGNYSLDMTDSLTGAVLWRSGNFSVNAGSRGLFAITDYFGPGDTPARIVSVTEQGSITLPGENLPSALRIANMRADLGPLSVFANGELFAENLPFGAISDYLPIAVGLNTFTVEPFGEVGNTLADPVEITFGTGDYHTLTITGVGDTTSQQAIIDEVRRVPARLQLIATNAISGTSVFDMYVVESGVSIENRFPQLTSLAPIPSADSSRTLTLVAGSYDLYLTQSGTRTVVIGPTRIDLADNAVYTIYVTDKAGGGEPVELLFADDFN
ncbi:MAG: DUF4397 domain-containing protein [Pseudomonadota bacterium]